MSDMHLAHHALQSEPIRKGFGRGLLQAGQLNENVVAICADLTESTQIHLFAEAFPERFVDVGVAEQNLANEAIGVVRFPGSADLRERRLQRHIDRLQPHPVTPD